MTYNSPPMTEAETSQPSRPSRRPSNRPSMGPSAPRPTPFSKIANDLPASIVVFLVALPLCLGIAHASGAPLVSGMITGILGGMLVAWLSGSQLGVSGPAAGLTTIVLASLDESNSHFIGYQAFLLAVVLSGVMQIGLGLLQAGIVAYYFPTNVIKGLLAAIGAILILKQLPHAVGIDTDWMGDESLVQEDGRNTFTELFYALANLRIGALLVAGSGLAVIVALDRFPAISKIRVFQVVPAPLLAVLIGVGLNLLFGRFMPSWAIEGDDLVRLPTGGPMAFLEELSFPDFTAISNPMVWTTALTLAAVASLETLLCVEAIDKLDPYKRSTPTNRELLAQGVGNMVAGALGGLPMTAVIVRGSANIQAGGRTKLSAFFHGVWLLLAVLIFASVLNQIPLASLAAVLLYVGYKLTRATLWQQMWKLGWEQFVPFAATFAAILFTDLLKGVGVGLAIAVFTLLRRNFLSPYFIHRRENTTEDEVVPVVRIELAEHVSFLHKAAVRRVLEEIPKGSIVEIDATGSRHIDRDVLEIIDDFKHESALKDIQVHTEGLPEFIATTGGH
jgi:MFS superfamily sulfate permease-like transporter